MQPALAVAENLSLSNPFEVLGLKQGFKLDESALDDALVEASLRWHPDRWVGTPIEEQKEAERSMAEINEAFALLKDPLSRSKVLLKLHGAPLPEGTDKNATPEFLMEIMELKEEAKAAAANPETLSRFRIKLLGMEIADLEKLPPLFEALKSSGDTIGLENPTLDTLRAQLNRLFYLRRTREDLEHSTFQSA